MEALRVAFAFVGLIGLISLFKPIAYLRMSHRWQALPWLAVSIIGFAAVGPRPQTVDNAQQAAATETNGPELKAKQANHEAACVAKGHSAAVCEQTNPADDYTDEYRADMLTHVAAIGQCLDGSVESCKLIEKKNLGHCASYAMEVVAPLDAEYLAEQHELCGLEVQIISEAAGKPVTAHKVPHVVPDSSTAKIVKEMADREDRAACIKKELGARFDDATLPEILAARKACGINDPADAEEKLREQRERLSR
jgi:hypothetical protein